MALLRLQDLSTRLRGLAVPLDRPRWVYASPANLRRECATECTWQLAVSYVGREHLRALGTDS
jgi:hypothetical protein